MDIVSKEKRSRIMSGIKGKNTKPELLLRSALHKLGFRFRIQRKDLPGKPDIVLPKYKTIIFVHGCFWHQHPGCKFANMTRDQTVQSLLKEMGWNVIVIWECQLNNDPLFIQQCSKLIQGAAASSEDS